MRASVTIQPTHVNVAPPYGVKPARHKKIATIITYNRKLPGGQEKPKNIIQIGGIYTWEEVKWLLYSDLRNRFQFPINTNSQITLTTKVFTPKALTSPSEDIFNAERENHCLVYKYGQKTKFTMGVTNEAMLGHQAKLLNSTEKMAIDFSILSLSRKYANFNKVHMETPQSKTLRTEPRQILRVFCIAQSK